MRKEQRAPHLFVRGRGRRREKNSRHFALIPRQLCKRKAPEQDRIVLKEFKVGTVMFL